MQPDRKFPGSMPSGLTGVPCPNQDLLLAALDQLAQHAVQFLCDCIDIGEAGMADAPLPRCNISTQRHVRNWVAAMLNKLPVSCRTLRATARDDPRYSPVLFYERTRLGAAASGHFLEGLPPGLPLFSGHTKVSLNDADLRKLRLRDVVCDRMKTVASLELFLNTAPKYLELARDFALPDVPAGLPGRVHIFVSRMRGICQGLQRVKPAAHLKQCKNCSCNRLFYCGSAVEGGGPSPSSSQSPHSPSANSQAFWTMAAGAPDVVDEQGLFCTYSCLREWRWQLKEALPECSDAVLVVDTNCRKTGRARVPEALRLVGKRNERAGRLLRTIEKTRRSFPALSGEELAKQRARVVRMHNVDLGVLYAASLLSENRGMSSNKVLAGATEGWRSRAAFYAKAVRDVGKLHDTTHKSGNIIGNLLVHEPFLSKLKQKAKALF